MSGAVRDHAWTDAPFVPRASRTRSRARPRTLVVDLDHTLFDWTRGWAAATRAAFDVLGAGGVDRGELARRFLATHRREATMDAPRTIEDLLDRPLRGVTRDLARRAAYASRETWRLTSIVVPGIAGMLSRLSRAGIRLVGYTESTASASTVRLALAGLNGALDLLVCTRPEPAGVSAPLRTLPDVVQGRARVHIAPHWRKGTARALAELLAEHGIDPARVCVLGDHREKDIAPAVELGIPAAWARYGTWRAPADDELVRALCHWPASAHVPDAAGPPPDAVVDDPRQVPEWWPVAAGQPPGNTHRVRAGRD